MADRNPGRPRNPKPRKRDQPLAIRVTEAEKQRILKAAKAHRQSITDFIVSLTEDGGEES